MAKEAIVLAGGTNVGKTRTLISLAWTYPDSQVHIFDPDNKVNLLLEELGLVGTMPNLFVHPVSPNWQDSLQDKYDSIKEKLTEKDYVCFDMMGRFWDLAQAYFAREVFDSTPAQHVIELRKLSKQANFNGFDGLADWPTIKGLHNEGLIDDAILWRPFNVVATTALVPFSPKDKLPKTGAEGMLAQDFNAKLEGEKNNIFRFNTIGVLYQAMETGKFFFKIYKHKTKVAIPPLTPYDITGIGFWQGYEEFKT